jgi:hypothetical protein
LLKAIARGQLTTCNIGILFFGMLHALSCNSSDDVSLLNYHLHLYKWIREIPNGI